MSSIASGSGISGPSKPTSGHSNNPSPMGGAPTYRQKGANGIINQDLYDHTHNKQLTKPKPRHRTPFQNKNNRSRVSGSNGSGFGPEARSISSNNSGGGIQGSPQASVTGRNFVSKPTKSQLTGDLGSGAPQGGATVGLMIVADDVNPLAMYIDADGNPRLPQFAVPGQNNNNFEYMRDYQPPSVGLKQMGTLRLHPMHSDVIGPVDNSHAASSSKGGGAESLGDSTEREIVGDVSPLDISAGGRINYDDEYTDTSM